MKKNIKIQYKKKFYDKFKLKNNKKIQVEKKIQDITKNSTNKFKLKNNKKIPQVKKNVTWLQVKASK